MSEIARCSLCGEPMPEGEEMFKFHGYSGDCPKQPLSIKETKRLLGARTPIPVRATANPLEIVMLPEMVASAKAAPLAADTGGEPEWDETAQTESEFFRTYRKWANARIAALTEELDDLRQVETWRDHELAVTKEKHGNTLIRAESAEAEVARLVDERDKYHSALQQAEAAIRELVAPSEGK